MGEKLKRWLKVNGIALIIPLFILGYVIYWNWLPFGYEKIFAIEVGKDNDLNSGKELYLINSEKLGPRTCEDNIECFRMMNQPFQFGFKPDIFPDQETKITLIPRTKEANELFYKLSGIIYPIEETKPIYSKEGISVYGDENYTILLNTIELENQEYFAVPRFYYIPESSDALLFDLDLSKPLENNSNFILGDKNLLKQLRQEGDDVFYKNLDSYIELGNHGSDIIRWNLNTPIDKMIIIPGEGDKSNMPKFIGGGYEFDGVNDYLEILGTYDKFENESFLIEVEVEPYDVSGFFQEIVGHFNWELLVSENKTMGVIGRVNNPNGEFYKTAFQAKNGRQKIMMIYSAGKTQYLFKENALMDLIPLNGHEIFNDYNSNVNLRIGRTNHNQGSSKPFYGKAYSVKIYNFEKMRRYIVFNEKSSQKIVNSENIITMFPSEATRFNEISLRMKK